MGRKGTKGKGKGCAPSSMDDLWPIFESDEEGDGKGGKGGKGGSTGGKGGIYASLRPGPRAPSSRPRAPDPWPGPGPQAPGPGVPGNTTHGGRAQPY